MDYKPFREGDYLLMIYDGKGKGARTIYLQSKEVIYDRYDEVKDKYNKDQIFIAKVVEANEK